MIGGSRHTALEFHNNFGRNTDMHGFPTGRCGRPDVETTQIDAVSRIGCDDDDDDDKKEFFWVGVIGLMIENLKLLIRHPWTVVIMV